MSDVLHVVNAGSSSIKFSAFLEQGETLELLLKGQVEGFIPRLVSRLRMRRAPSSANGSGPTAKSSAMMAPFRLSPRFCAGSRPGHRIVHGGLDFAEPVLLDAGIVERLEKFIPQAPLHQPHNLAPIRLLLAITGLAAGGLLRHRLSSQSAGGGSSFRVAARNHRARRAPLRLSRPLL
jgi:acetate kinase